MDFISPLLSISILSGQIIKIPLFNNLGPTLLDFFIISFNLIGLYQLRLKLKKPPIIVKLGLIFTLIAILSLVFTPLNLSASEYLSSFSYIVRFLLFVTLVWIIYSGAFLKFRKKIKLSLLYSGVGLAILGLLQLLFFPNLMFMEQFGWDPHYFRTVSTFFDPNFAGAYFVLTLILLTSLRAERSNLGKGLLRRLWLLAMTIVYIALLTTFSRSSYLMFLVSGIALSFFQRSKKIFISTLLLFSLLMIGFYLYTQLVANPRNIDRQDSASYRFSTWHQGWELFQKAPILGVGFNAYRYAIDEYNLGSSQFLESRGSTSNDSSLLFVLATSGVLGFVIYILFLFHLPRVAMAGLLVHSIFANSLFYPPIFLWLLLTSISPKE